MTESGSHATAALDQPLPDLLVVYDGECGLCDATIQRLLTWDTHRVLRYTPNQGETFAALRGRWPGLEPENTVYFVRREAGELRIYARSQAIFQLSRHLGMPWRALSWFRVVPRMLTDAVYNLIARNRLSIWGKVDACRMPLPDERALFLP